MIKLLSGMRISRQTEESYPVTIPTEEKEGELSHNPPYFSATK